MGYFPYGTRAPFGLTASHCQPPPPVGDHDTGRIRNETRRMNVEISLQILESFGERGVGGLPLFSEHTNSSVGAIVLLGSSRSSLPTIGSVTSMPAFRWQGRYSGRFDERCSLSTQVSGGQKSAEVV